MEGTIRMLNVLDGLIQNNTQPNNIATATQASPIQDINFRKRQLQATATEKTQSITSQPSNSRYLI
jgi:hypothetical protein